MRKSFSSLDALDAVAHGFFTRRGGVSEGFYASLNAGYGSGDASDKVAENRARIAAALGSPAGEILTAYQIHSATAVIVEAPFARDDAPQADALVTNIPGLALGVLTADCAPILLAEPKARVIAAAHAGWKGAAGGIVESTLASMESLGAKREAVVAAIGPCIAQDSYEVGSEFRQNFLGISPENARFFAPSARRKGHFHFDLAGFVQQKLAESGVARVERMADDTCADESAFFSYRRATLRGEPVYGRQVSAIMLK